MNEPCYIKASLVSGVFTIECFNLSIFDVLFIFNDKDRIHINSFYAVDDFGSDNEIHIVESEINTITDVESLFLYFTERGEYGEKFTINEFNFSINDINIKIEDDYLVWIEFKNEDSNKYLLILSKILYLLHFTKIQSVLTLIMNNLNKYIVCKENENCEVVENYNDIANIIGDG